MTPAEFNQGNDKNDGESKLIASANASGIKVFAGNNKPILQGSFQPILQSQNNGASYSKNHTIKLTLPPDVIEE